MEVAMFEVSSSISYVEDRDVLGTKLGCNKRAKSKMAAVHDRVASAGRFLVSLSPVKENLVDYLG